MRTDIRQKETIPPMLSSHDKKGFLEKDLFSTSDRTNAEDFILL